MMLSIKIYERLRFRFKQQRNSFTGMPGRKGKTPTFSIQTVRCPSRIAEIHRDEEFMSAILYIQPNDSPRIQTSSDHSRIMFFDDCFLPVYITDTICFILLFS